ncbi:MAG: FAD-dependent oxidoreductase [Sphaerobacter sp.]|nr:FAD-dependent oxidoreductase [Sphaerobacter sp.]
MSQADVAIVGAGPAGCAAALAAAEAGARVVLLDEQPGVGGQLRWRVAPVHGLAPELEGLPGVRAAAALAERLAAAGVEVRSGTVAWGLFEDNVLGLVAGEAATTLRAAHVIVASGSTDRVEPFHGWTLPGVLTARAAQIFLHIHRVLPGRQIVVVGSGAEADEVAHDLAAAGAEVVARAAGTDQLQASGDGGVAEVQIGEQAYAADTIVLALGRQPDPALALQARVATGYDAAAGGQVPLRDARLATSQPGLSVVGDAAGLVTLAEGWAEGRLAGLVAAGADDAAIAAAQDALEHRRSPERAATVARLRAAAGA